jgi:pimeloyl-ACP methyl ester carboxylesterase
VDEFLKALGLEEVTLIGHSMGGAICIQFCLDFPEKVKCLGLVNTGAKLGVNPQLLSILRTDFRKAVEVGFESILGRKIGERISWIVEEMLKIDPAIGLADFEACNKFDSREKIPRIEKPTLIIGGSEDVLTPPWFHQYLHDKIRNSTLEMIEGVGHLTMVENSERFNTILSEFLRKYIR